MPTVPAVALTVIEAALEDAQLLGEPDTESAERIAQYLISSGYQITADTTEQATT